MRQVKRDPAPSRWAWRLERLLLTPSVRFGLRVGVPFALVFSLGSWYLGQSHVQTHITDFVADTRASFEQRPEFMVNLLAIDGAGPELAQTIRETLPAPVDRQGGIAIRRQFPSGDCVFFDIFGAPREQ